MADAQKEKKIPHCHSCGTEGHRKGMKICPNYEADKAEKATKKVDEAKKPEEKVEDAPAEAAPAPAPKEKKPRGPMDPEKKKAMLAKRAATLAAKKPAEADKSEEEA